MKSDYCILVLSMAPIITAYSSSAHAEFEASMLKQLGVSASTLDQLESNKSPAGKYLVDVYLNGNKVTSDWVMVGDDGEVKKDGQFFSLIFPEIDPSQFSKEEISSMKVELNRTTSSLQVVIPEALFKKYYEEYPSKNLGALLNYTFSMSRSSIKRHYSQYPTTGIATLLNYNLSASNSQLSSTTERQSFSSVFGKFETNLLFNGWSLKNNMYYSKQNKDSNFYRESSFVERKFESGEQVQAGEIVTQNSLFSGLSLVGAQYAPETSFTQLGTTQAIKGFADTPSKIEVVQNGNVIYSTRVPVGEFALSNVPVNTASQNLMIRIVGDDGRIITYPYVVGNAINTSSNSWYSIALGQFRNTANISGSRSMNSNSNAAMPEKNKFALTGTYNLALSQKQNISVAALITEAYQNMATAYSINLFDNVIAGTYQMFLSRYGRTSQTGGKISASTNINIERATASLNYSYRSQDYLDPYDIYGGASPLLTNDGRIDNSNKLKQSLSTSLSYPLPANIAASVGVGVDQYYSGKSYKRMYASLSKQFKYATASVFLQKSDNENSVFLNVSIPMGGWGIMGSSLSKVADQQSITTTYTNSYLDRKANVTVGTNSIKTKVGGNMYSFAQGSYRGSMTTYTGGVTYNKQKDLQGMSYNAGISGGVAITKKGIDFSSDRIDDTFAIASVEGENGVVIDGPSGPVSPTITGRAVISKVYPYRPNNISVNMDGLPQDVYAIGGEETVKSGFGGISYVTFKFGKNITGLYKLLAKVGEPLIAGAVVATDSGEFVTVVGPEQNLAIDYKAKTDQGAQHVYKYLVSENDVPRCKFELTEKLIKEKSGDVICYPLK
ncbi:hypothetical protein ACS33_02465 [Edwardsiella ictaluri]|uniref:fimbria/pilus outer membrane usher protein n=2 Tax=Edwardsiella ictaluri TaxID=67780 RepID=UPI00065D7A40|nr:hypothetical protein ABY58_01890 [Edwardsiella ictaluri]KOO56108.1 hypothetical protein ACS33_02465 [Edwardsiella ictaluri]